MIKEKKESKSTVQREKLAGYLYDLSKLTFAAIVLGAIVPMLSESNIEINLKVFILGFMLTVVFAIGAYYVLTVKK